jgi:hypothetical protein
MKCPLYFTAINRGIEYTDLISLCNSIFEIRIDNECKFGQDIIIFENENYIVNENITGKVIRQRKALTSFTELVIKDILQKYGYDWVILSPQGNEYGKGQPDKLCFKLYIKNGMMYYNTQKSTFYNYKI